MAGAGLFQYRRSTGKRQYVHAEGNLWLKQHNIFITGGTGYLGRNVIPRLLKRGHVVRALVRHGSERKLPAGSECVLANALDGSTFAGTVPPCDTFIHLVGVSHPSPVKAKEFRDIDLVSIRESIGVAAKTGIRHFIYLSVVQPAGYMKRYAQVRAEGEAMIRTSGISATILRPWYVLGPGHQWPSVLKPLYWLMERIPSKRARALHYGLVTLEQMLASIVHAVEHPPAGVSIRTVADIRHAPALLDQP